MSSNYRNFRNNVPWLIFFLEAVFIVLFYFLFSGNDANVSFISYPAFQDVNHMVLFGFGFFLTFLKRYGFSSTGFNLLIIALGVQCSALMGGFLDLLYGMPQEHGMTRITKATVSTTAVVISAGAVLGKTNPVQLILMTVLEIIFFYMSRWVNNKLLQLSDNSSMMHVHLFGAYFGLAVSSCFSEPSPRSEKNASTPKSDLLSMLAGFEQLFHSYMKRSRNYGQGASPWYLYRTGRMLIVWKSTVELFPLVSEPLFEGMIGTLFLWVFWPSFNSVLVVDKNWKLIYNTYIALAVSAVTAFTLSAMTTKDGKFRMAHIHSAVLAGGVALAYTDLRVQYPWIAMIVGLLASVIAILGSYCLQRCLNPPLKIHDSSGVHFTFGLPAALGTLAWVVLVAVESGTYFPGWGHLIMFRVGAFCATISIALITGLITGFILNLKLFKTAPVSKYFEDQFYWEFPHLAVGF